jgi:hypothetical protein
MIKLDENYNHIYKIGDFGTVANEKATMMSYCGTT